MVLDVFCEMADADNILQQLSILSFVASSAEECPVQVDNSIITTNMGSYQNHTMRIKLQNISTVTMARGWSLSVLLQHQLCGLEEEKDTVEKEAGESGQSRIYGQRHSDKKNVARIDSASVSYTHSLPSLTPRAFECVDVTMNERLLSMLPLDLTVSLTFTFNSKISAKNTNCNNRVKTDDCNGEAKSVSVVVLSDVVDIMRLLVLEGEGVIVEPHVSTSVEEVSYTNVSFLVFLRFVA